MIKPLGDPFKCPSSLPYEFTAIDKEKLEMLWRKVGEIIEEINTLEQYLNASPGKDGEPLLPPPLPPKTKPKPPANELIREDEDMDKSLTHSRPEPKGNPPTEYPTSSPDHTD